MAPTPEQMLAFEWTMIAVTLCLVVLRLYVQIRRPIYLSTPRLRIRILLEFLVVFAWFHFLISGITDTLIYRWSGFESDNGSLALDVEKLKTENHIHTLKVYYAQTILYYNPLYAVKCHFLIFYRVVLIPRSMRNTRFCLDFVTVIVLLGWAGRVLLNTFGCQPISRNWSLDDDVFCSPMQTRSVWLTMTIPHLVTDLCVYFLPVPVLLQLRGTLSWQQKAYACVSFGFGFLCIVFALLQWVLALTSADMDADYIAAAMEQTWAIVVVCVPAFKLFVRNEVLGQQPESLVSRNPWATGNGNPTDASGSSEEKLSRSSSGEERDMSKGKMCSAATQTGGEQGLSIKDSVSV